ncbi:BON domain-containing protein [Xylophilus sp. GOD-11R]|uniref:BON domain-containing protein n=1 Tax=Xylophilus sp. GOD-11R TaxID=3089814 RepID=UPI00298C8C60|nr:BON domain-containing protein [Xylophilus sp. GOD-11R]WPB59096.1 BON domain-containing protein [Xylophilus sp. GOD-11R]
MRNIATCKAQRHRWALLPLLASLGLALSACSPNDNASTPGQKIDAAIAKSKDVAADVKVEAQTALSNAQARIKQDGPKVEERAKDVASTTERVIDDVAITAQISASLAKDSELSALKIDVDTKDGAVILRGPAPTTAARDRAADLARAVTGVRTVDNQLVVKAG